MPFGHLPTVLIAGASFGIGAGRSGPEGNRRFG